jgi:DNA gyrase/topoisomerase IV subunit A
VSEECNAGIDGGCGACEKCDPEFWLRLANERVAELESANTELKQKSDLKDVQARDLGGLVLELQQECIKLREENAALKDTNLYRLFKKWMTTAMELKEKNAKLKEILTAWTQTRTHTCASPEFMELMRGTLVVLEDRE